jgi:hypothetical protein
MEARSLTIIQTRKLPMAAIKSLVFAGENSFSDPSAEDCRVKGAVTQSSGFEVKRPWIDHPMCKECQWTNSLPR